MPKPLTTAGVSLTQAYGSVAEELKRRIGEAVAAQAGPPIATPLVPNTEELQVNAWNARNPAATDEAMMELARQKYGEHVAAGMTPDIARKATAEDLTHFRYDQRLKLYTHGQVDYKEQVAEAQRLAKLAARQTTPDPPMPPPTMPSAALTNLTTLGMPPPPAAGTVLGKPTGGPPDLSPPPAAPAPEGMSMRPNASDPGLAPGMSMPPEPPIPGGY